MPRHYTGGKHRGFYRVDLSIRETISFLVGTGQMQAPRFVDELASETFAMETMRYVSKLSEREPGYAVLIGTKSDGRYLLQTAQDGLADIRMPPERLHGANLRQYETGNYA